MNKALKFVLALFLVVFPAMIAWKIFWILGVLVIIATFGGFAIGGMAPGSWEWTEKRLWKMKHRIGTKLEARFSSQ